MPPAPPAPPAPLPASLPPPPAPLPPGALPFGVGGGRTGSAPIVPPAFCRFAAAMERPSACVCRIVPPWLSMPSALLILTLAASIVPLFTSLPSLVRIVAPNLVEDDSSRAIRKPRVRTHRAAQIRLRPGPAVVQDRPLHKHIPTSHQFKRLIAAREQHGLSKRDVANSRRQQRRELATSRLLSPCCSRAAINLLNWCEVGMCLCWQQ
ncbi:hypothetical protein VARIO8X_150162 [Burkholderiales bacterium 8X]|nr:hypothetical protein VARIO8X_150162 [Burkholderiales bacterium 8X]